MDVFGEDVTIQFARVLGSAAARVAEAAVSMFIANVVPAVSHDASGLELARANTDATALLENVVLGFDVLLRHHVYAARRFDDIDTPGVDLLTRSIGFVDLVGSTAMSGRLEPAELATVVTEFETTASDVVTAHGGRVVKLIGDEVMFATSEPAAAVEIALRLVETFDEHDRLPPVRAAVATGRVVSRDGDYAGVVVNLAARAVKQARPGSLLVDRATGVALDSELLRIRNAGPFALKGFPERVSLFRVRPPS
jgi:adenylate cyclase